MQELSPKNEPEDRKFPFHEGLKYVLKYGRGFH